MNSNVAVTVRDGAGVLQPGITVYAVKTTGSIQASAATNASGVATLSLPADSYRFKVTEADSDFFSGAAGHCTTPTCTSAQITITRVDVTVVLTDGTPLVNHSVWWETPQGQTGGYVFTDANGHSNVAVPAGSYAFFNEVNGYEFPSGAAGHCVVPGCTTATIVETLPVTVTVRNPTGVLQANVVVAWEDANGVMGGWEPTDANGVVMLSVPQGSITFKVDPDNDVQFTSSPACVVPGCTSASITVASPVTVTVTETGGAPIVGKKVYWENAAGTAGSGTNTNASGVATLTPPMEPVRFKITVDGTNFYSATTTNCSQPGCTTAAISVNQQSVVTVVDGSGNPISGRAVTPVSTEGITSANKTTDTSGHATFRLPSAHWQFKAKCSANNETFFSGNAGHCALPGGCATATIKMPCGQCAGKANGFACDDQNPCTTTSTCQSQFCTGGSAVNCSASDGCHDPGVCGVATGGCSNPTKPNGASCSDGNACTQSDTCQAGACTGSNPVTCSASDQCHDAGTCNPSTGACSNPAKANGTVCNDGDSCTQTDSCQSGTCTGGNPVSCVASDQCHDAGTCNPATGACSNPPKTNGAACNDGNACTQADTCQSGACTGANPVSCVASDQCHDAGTCNPSTGACSNPAKANGTSCNDGNGCTVADACQSGTCTGNAVTCSASDQCHNAGTCNPSTGVCSNPAKADGASCSDGNNCTSGDTCQSGGCTGGTNTCGSVALTQVINSGIRPTMSATLDASSTFVVPGDPIDFIATVTNTGALTNIGGDFRLTNTGTSTFTIRGFSETLEYQAVPSGVWTPFARATYDTAGNVVPETTLQPMTFWWFYVLPDGSGATYPPNPGNGNQATGTTIEAGGNAHLGFGGPDMQLPADLVNIIFDPEQSAGIRVVLRIDMPSGSPQTAPFSLDQAYAGMSRDITDLSPLLHMGYAFAPDHVAQVQSTESGPLSAGASRIFTGTAPAPLIEPWPLYEGENEAAYGGRLGWAQGGFNPLVRVAGHGLPYDPLMVDGYSQHIDVELPVLFAPEKSGPPTINAGLTRPYSVLLRNNGNSPLSDITLTDSVDGVEIPITDLSLPVSLASVFAGPASSTATATFKAQVPLDRPVGPLTDVATMTWKDRKGNLYGPLTARYTNTVTPGHPEGYLSVDVATGFVDTIGISKPIVVTALDPYGNPAPGVAVHFVVTGDNPQTVDIPTGTDGKATFSYSGTKMGNDTVVASATITTTLLTLDPIQVQWGQSIGTPCTGRATPLDVIVAMDVSGSMVLDPPFNVNNGRLEAAGAAAKHFVDDLLYPRDQIGVVTFMGGAFGGTFGPVTFAQLSTDPANAKANVDGGVNTGIFCTGAICLGGSDVAYGIRLALDELDTPRHRPEAQKVIVYIGDGGADNDPTDVLARAAASNVRIIALGVGSNIDSAMVRRVASSPNDYFYSPSGAGIDYAFNSLNQDLCRNRPPFVSAGGDQGLYNVRIPASLTLQGEVHDDGAGNDPRLTSEWTVVSGPGPVAFTDASSPVTDALFGLPGTYVLQLEGSDGYMSVIDRATVTVDPDPSIVGANLVVALTAPGPLETGQNETLTATLTDSLGAPIRDYAVRVTVGGANPVTTTVVTNALGAAAFVYKGAKAGTDVLHGTALGSSFSLDSNFVTVDWVQPASGGAFLVQGWIGAPLDQAKLMGRIPVTLSPDVTLTNGMLTYFPASTPTDVHVLATNLSGQPGATLATFDTTVLSNGSYVVQLDGTNAAGNHKTSVVLLTVTGDYKPGRVVVETTDFSVPIAGLPITIGRRYDSLDKDKIGDFGYGWSLAIGHPRLEVNPNFGVALTLPNGRRATFDLQVSPATDEFGLNIFAGFFHPSYVGEPGVYGSLTQEGGCPIVKYNPGNPANPLTCLLLGTLPYAPDAFTYTDPYGTAYRMAASGELKSITDRQGNTLSFEANGIISSTGKSVTFMRDEQGRITKIDYPAFLGPDVDAARYAYDPVTGDLTTVDLAMVVGTYRTMHHTYSQHRLLTSTDPNGNTARTSTYDANGRLATDKDAMNNVTSYAYDLDARKTTTTYPDNGAVEQVFDARGLLLSEKDQRNHTTTHEYDQNRNETKRTNARGEVTTAIYDERGNQTSVTDPTGTTHTTYNDQNQPTTFKDRLGHVTTIEYDDRQVPKRFADELGTRFTSTNSEQGLPLTIDDAAGKRAYIEYDAAGNVTARTDRLGRVTRQIYDEGGYVRSATTARGGVTLNNYFHSGKLSATLDPVGRGQDFGYDPAGNLTVQSENGRQTNYTYNALNQLTEQHYYPSDTFVSYTRDFRGNPLTMTDENGHTTTYEYDKAGNLTKTTFADQTFTTRTYDELNRPASVTDERGKTTTYAYDVGCGCSNRVTTVTDPLGHATVTTYDANGRRASVTDANDHTTTFVYDVRGHVVETHYADGTSTSEAYDTRGRRTSMTDQMGKTTLYGYDDQGQLTSVTDPLSNVTHYAYDLDGNLASVTDANNHTTTYDYDLLKRKTKRTLPMGQFETFAYDLRGNQTSHTDFRGKITTLTFDTLDRMLTKVPDPSLGEPSHTYVYSPTGKRLSTTDGSGATTYAYDARDRMLTKAATAGTLTYTYDPAGNVATIRSSNTNGTSVDYAWDDANQLASVTDNRVGGTTTTAYTPTNRPSALSQPNGIGLTYSYDALDRVTSMLWRQGTAPAFGSWAYTHNERGQRLSSTDVTGRAATYAYDAASRLSSETISGDPRGASFNGALLYALDGAGNRLSRTSTLAALGAQSFTYNANDEISGDTVDANGNTLTSGGHTFAYDFENRLVSKDSGAVTIAYDCDGNRVAKTVGGVTTRYLIDDLNPTGYLQVLEEVVGGAVQARYTYGDRIVSQTRDVPTSPATRYYGFDAHGNTGFLTDASGAVTDSYDYDAWGLLVASTGSTPNSRIYAGEELDPDLGLINLRARQYRPATGRLMTLDPQMGSRGEPITLNRYLYANGDPVDLLDPSGRMATVEWNLVRKLGEAASKVSAAQFWTGAAAVLGYLATAAEPHSAQTIFAADAVCAVGAAKVSATVGGERGFAVGIACVLTVLAGAFVAPPH